MSKLLHIKEEICPVKNKERLKRDLCVLCVLVLYELGSIVFSTFFKMAQVRKVSALVSHHIGSLICKRVWGFYYSQRQILLKHKEKRSPTSSNITVLHKYPKIPPDFWGGKLMYVSVFMCWARTWYLFKVQWSWLALSAMTNLATGRRLDAWSGLLWMDRIPLQFEKMALGLSGY